MSLIKLGEKLLVLRGDFVITITTSGDFSKITAFFNKMKSRDVRSILDRYGQMGVSLLSEATPVRSGLTASSWSYDIQASRGRYDITWSNSNVNKGVNIAIIIQYGHGTRNGGYVQGIDYINPAIQTVFQAMADELWREVTSA